MTTDPRKTLTDVFETLNPTMRGAAAHLVGSALILAAIAGGICVLMALLVGDSFLETLRIALWSFVAVFVLLVSGWRRATPQFAASSAASSPTGSG